MLHWDDASLVAARERCFGVLTTALERAVAEGRLSAKRMPLVRIAAWAIVHGLAALRRSDAYPATAGGGEDALARAVTDLFAHSVLPPPAGIE